ncbi:MAG: hypothetical protein M1820_000689 [Bogoriella megaspora]|nr:MAG: hypothetical protein M1820_000689 [Bogoriella megaspora]
MFGQTEADFNAGKPGYGKTLLCTTIVEDIRSSISRQNSALQGSSESQPPRPSVGFYFFDKQRLEASHPESACRAIATQLLHANQTNRDIIDLALLMKDRNSSGQLSASDEEIRSLLEIYLQKLPSTILVVDGLDESSNTERFLQYLDKLLSRSSSLSVLLSSRPTVTVTDFIRAKTNILLLEELGNYKDIVRYLEPEIQNLFTTGKLQIHDPLQAVVGTIAERSHSMFLWANLMIQYLKSDFMTPQDRQEAIYDLSLFDELDGLYTQIIQRLHRMCPGERAWTNISKLFQWLAFACRPLQVAELQAALAIQIGKSTPRSRYITKFKDNVVKMSGALAEVDSAGTIRFIHASVLEYIERAGKQTMFPVTRDLDCPLKINKSDANRSICTDCLSYLLYDAPKACFSHGSNDAPIVSTILRPYPLLRYSSQFWAPHAEAALMLEIPGAKRSVNDLDGSRLKLATILGQFVMNKVAVTSWTEASFFFGCYPTLSNLPSMIQEVLGSSDARSSETFMSFSRDLERLNTGWGKLLSESPWEIWEPSIPAFLQSSFWVGTNAAELASFDTEARHLPNASNALQTDAIMIASASSINGHEVGMIKVWPSRIFAAAMSDQNSAFFETQQNLELCSQNWQLDYLIRDVSTYKVNRSVTLAIPDGEIFAILAQYLQTPGQDGFRFPVSFSADLRQIAVLGCVIRITSPLSSDRACSYHLQQFLRTFQDSSNRSPGPTHPDLSPVISWSDGEEQFSDSFYAGGFDSRDWYQTSFSRDNHYLACLQGSGKPSHRSFYDEWDLIIYEDQNCDRPDPFYQYLSHQRTRLSAFATTRSFTFHPCEPILVVSRLGVTSLWFFARLNSEFVNICAQPLNDLEFSNCGTYVYGTQLESCTRGKRMIISIASHVNEMKRLMVDCRNPHAGNQNIENRLGLEMQSYATNRSNGLEKTQHPSIIESNSVVFCTGQGTGHITMLKQFNEEGQVVLERLGEDGLASSHCLTRLPQSSTLEKSYTTLLGSLDVPDSISLVLHKAAEEHYSLRPQDFQLPAILTRSLESIPRWTEQQIPLRIDEARTENHRKRRRIAN